MCFSPRHDLTLAQMPAAEIRVVVDTWAQQIADLGRHWRWVQVFDTATSFTPPAASPNRLALRIRSLICARSAAACCAVPSIARVSVDRVALFW